MLTGGVVLPDETKIASPASCFDQQTCPSVLPAAITCTHAVLQSPFPAIGYFGRPQALIVPAS